MSGSGGQKLWQRLPGKSRQYENTQTGQVISDRQYRKLPDSLRNAPRTSFTIERLQSQRYKQGRYNHLIRAFQEQAQKDGVNLSLQQIRRSETFKTQIIDQLRVKNKNGKPSIRAVKQALINLGLREGIPDWVRPGDSPKYKSIRASVSSDSEARKLYANLRK